MIVRSGDLRYLVGDGAHDVRNVRIRSEKRTDEIIPPTSPIQIDEKIFCRDRRPRRSVAMEYTLSLRRRTVEDAGPYNKDITPYFKIFWGADPFCKKGLRYPLAIS